MKSLRKFSILILFTAIFFIILGLPIKIFADGNSFSNYGATYRVKEVIDERDLGYGVKFHRELSTLATNVDRLTNCVVDREYAQQVNVLEFSTSSQVQLVPYAFIDGGNWVATTVRKAALQYEGTHPGYKVIAAVNGDFFAIDYPQKASTGVTISQGEYYKSLSNHGNVNTLAIRNTGEGKQLFETKVNDTKPFLTIYDNNDNIIKKVQIDRVNQVPGDSEVSLYYANRDGAYSSKFQEQKASNVWVVNRGIYGCTTREGSFYGVGKISSFSTAEINLVSSQFAIASNNKEISDLLGEGVKIRCQYEYTDPSLEGVENFIGFPYNIVSNGNPLSKEQIPYGHDNIYYRHPRTIIGQKENGEIVLATVDGRQGLKDGLEGYWGASAIEMAAVMGYYDCVDAWNLDGGGSTTMIVRKQEGWKFDSVYDDDSNWYVANSPSDSSERSDGNHLLVVIKLPEIKVDYAELGEKFITLNIALLSDIEKYSNLYVYFENEYHEVVDGLVTFNGLDRNTKYSFSLYAKIDDKMVDLMTDFSYYTNKQTPAGINSVKVGIQEKNGEKYILIRYSVQKGEAIETIILVSDQRYLTTGTSIFIPKTAEFYQKLYESIIEINYNINEILEDGQIIIDDFEFTFDSVYIVDEIEFTINDFIGNIFE